MFNDKYGLTQAVLDGRKTFTRRIIDYSRNKVFLDLLGDEYYMKHEGALSYDYDDDVLRIDDDFDCYILKPKYKIGEKVAIAQSYSQCGDCRLIEDEDANGEAWCAFHQKPVRCDSRACEDILKKGVQNA